MNVASFYRLSDCSFYIWTFDHTVILTYQFSQDSLKLPNLHFHTPTLKDLAVEISKIKTSQFIGTP